MISEILDRFLATEKKDTTPRCFVVPAQNLVSLLQELRHNSSTYFDMLSCITGIDNGVEAGTLEVIYHLYSIPFHQSLALQVILPRENPEVDSVSQLWKTAEWHEREAYDLFGIRFRNHPDLRRILLPADWEGHPLRKDYTHAEKYHGITVAYQAPEPPTP